MGSWEWDIHADRLRANDAVAEMLCVAPEQVTSGISLARFADCIHPDDRDEVMRRMRQNAADGASVVAEFRLIARDGTERWVLVRGRYDLDEAGRPIRGQGILVDMTGSRLSDRPYGRQIGSASAHPLERAVDHCLSARDAIAETDERFLMKLVDMLLLELGRQLTKLIQKERRQRLS
ncbi:PAS domain-containing protein [Methylobacterium sp. ID0610]|uniref:PAS domain-containing protein n=1 Tax=Methylobacterium carpenticola TaxID=3344827 RepID=UPI0036870656